MDEQPVNRPNIKVVILAGSYDFGRCPLATRLPMALWPVAEKAILERLLRYLANQGVTQVTIVFRGGRSSLLQWVRPDNHLELKLFGEQLPIGTAGCVRDGAGDEKDALVLVFSASIVSPPQIDTLISAHRGGQCDLTIMFNPGGRHDQPMGEAADIYVCSPSILERIPRDGYFDIKEGLIPEMLSAGKSVHAARLPKPVGNFRDRQGYLRAMANYLQSGQEMDLDLRPCKHGDSQIIWAADSASIDRSVRFYGPLVIMDNAQISKGTIILGPTIIGRNVRISQGSTVVNSVLWDDAQIGPNCQIQRCVVDYHASLPPNTVVEEKSIPFRVRGILEVAVDKALTVVKTSTTKLRATSQPELPGINAKLLAWVKAHKGKILVGLAIGVVLVAFLWSYWPGVIELWSVWQQSDEYSSGLLVPFLVVYILWSRRNDLAQLSIRPCLWGIMVFVAAQALRIFSQALMYSSAENLSVALSIAAVVLLLFGWQLFRKVFTVLLFLCLMLPWPNRVQAAVTLPLQRWATSSAVFCLETMGYNVAQEGNVIHIGNASVAVAEACNGLRMVTAFFVISGLVVLLAKRAWWEKLIVFASSLPVALLCNTMRLAITALAFTVVSGEYWEKVFHDFGGYAMMPLALAIVVAELWVLAKLTVPPEQKEGIIITRQK